LASFQTLYKAEHSEPVGKVLFRATKKKKREKNNTSDFSRLLDGRGALNRLIGYVKRTRRKKKRGGGGKKKVNI